MVEFIYRVPVGEAGEFTLFSLPHIIMMVVSIILFVLAWIYLPKIKDKKFESTFRYVIASYMIWTSLYVILYKTDLGVPWYGYLPEATCAWGNVFGALALLTKKRLLFVLNFFFGWGALTSLAAPNILEGVTRYYFYQFYIRHILVVFSALYMMRVFDYKVYRKDYILHASTLLTYAALVLPINLIINDPDKLNTLYFLRPAVNNVFLDALYSINYVVYIISWIIIGLLLGYLWGLPFYQPQKKKTV